MTIAHPILDSLNDKQREAVLTVHGPLLVVAGPGSGKTRVLVSRIAWLLADGHARPHEILAMTFTNKAAGEMLERAKKLLELAGHDFQFPSGRGRLWIGTFHSMFARIIRMHADRIGFTSDFSIYDQQDSEQVVKRLMEEAGIQNVKPRPVRGFISWAKNRMLSVGSIDPKSLVQREAVKLMEPYDRAMREANAMDFDDLLLKTYELLRKHDDVLEWCRRKWTHVMIDEFQDTNTLQYRLAQMMAQRHGNICAVGDDCQSIYAFRGADIRNMLLFSRDFRDTRIIRLEQNYRSSKNILRLADSVIKHNVGRIDKTLWTDNEDGNDIQVVGADSGDMEAGIVVSQIRTLMLRHRYRYRDFAVLYRTNRLSRQFEDALRTSGIPYRVYGSISFYQRKEVKNACAYLRLLANPNDVASFLRVVNYPKRGIGDVSQKAILAFARRSDGGLPYALSNVDEIGLRSAKARRELARFSQLLASHAEQLEEDDDVVATIQSLLRLTGMWEEIRSDDTIAVESRLENIQELLAGIKQHVSVDGGTLSSYLQQVELATSEDEADSSADSVTLMTAHASKGLEFEVVFICGLEEGLFPVTFGEESKTSGTQRPAGHAPSTGRILPAEVDFDRREVQTALHVIAHLVDSNSATSGALDSNAKFVLAGLRERLDADDAWPLVESALDALNLNRTRNMRALRRILFKEAAECQSVAEVLQCANAVRLRQEINSVSRSLETQQASDGNAHEEERRLFYVAVTRAKSRLILSWARRRFYAGGMLWGEPSRFLNELDQSLVSRPVPTRRYGSYGSYRTSQRGRSTATGGKIRSGRSFGAQSTPARSANARRITRIPKSQGVEYESVSAGDRVRHRMHGEGTVIRSSKTSYGEQAEIDFGDKGVKKLVLKYARLEKLT